ncbi:hypothetical protein HELRODRAFT_180356 [Helobdella robusta]|uniref:Uncharacterized protein n=1 Tax=Helobdella robusta TaxID=6412 RepID=T1FFT4_HELRO|nr:hypothetical protein HELRODRAFT_180356 [Helobdella robusta]ESN93947.1 hypothetical protein HELRODRAFT_180356 [Helobdella robusta]
MARPIRPRWVFGGIDSVTKEAFLVEVDRRDATELLPIIRDHVLPGDNVDNCASKKSWADRTAKCYTSQTSKQMKTYGTGISCPLKASKIIEEKISYYIGNVSTCNKNIIEDHLKQNNIAFLQCFPVLRKKNPDDPLVERSQTTESTAFKIIIPLNEREKLVNPDIWPMHTFLREWAYNMSASKKKNGNFRPTTININHGGNN